MLHLHSHSRQQWLLQVDQFLPEVLIDHAHCERKAASTAMSLMNAYVVNRALARAMTVIVQEELEHYELVLQLLERRHIKFCLQKPSAYGKQLHALIRQAEPQRVVDRLLVASLIEARSCERFDLLSKHVRQSDPELADFYASLFESEARHHTTYVALAEDYAPRSEVRLRLKELAEAEANILENDQPVVRMHS
jgi:tRNA 2-(methylsulfanyl)-N6-isopentenyladenosine37 hydroxylase